MFDHCRIATNLQVVTKFGFTNPRLDCTWNNSRIHLLFQLQFLWNSLNNSWDFEKFPIYLQNSDLRIWKTPITTTSKRCLFTISLRPNMLFQIQIPFGKNDEGITSILCAVHDMYYIPNFLTLMYLINEYSLNYLQCFAPRSCQSQELNIK